MPDVVELPGAPARLLSGTGAAVGLNSYAVVAYIPPPLGAFLNALRRELVPGCDYRSHVTVLPPRPLVGPAAEAWRQFREQARSFAAFEVEIGGVEMFASSQVVYLAVTAGSQPLRRMNLALNSGLFDFADPYPYHPHITLAQCIPPEQAGAVLEAARRRWAAYSGARAFPLDRLSFVRNSLNRGWLDLAQFRLAEPRAATRTA